LALVKTELKGRVDPAALQGLAESGFQIEKPRHVILAHDVPFTVRVGAVEQETSLSIGLGKPPATEISSGFAAC
jgi:hypothetical protein